MPPRVERIVAQVTGVQESAIEDATGPAAVPGWDSMAHLDLMLALEAEYRVRLTPEEMGEMLTVGRIKEVLRAKGARPA